MHKKHTQNFTDQSINPWIIFHGTLDAFDVQSYLFYAAIYTNSPIEWAEDLYLLDLIKKESNFQPSVQNKSSSAFGLFQMVKSTWKIHLPEVPHGVADPFWQCVGGLRYVTKNYKTPQRAHKFYLATYKKDSLLAPPDLQNKAQTWIDSGLHGY